MRTRKQTTMQLCDGDKSSCIFEAQQLPHTPVHCRLSLSTQEPSSTADPYNTTIFVPVRIRAQFIPERLMCYIYSLPSLVRLKADYTVKFNTV